MKKAYKVTFAAMLAAGLVGSACADEKDLWRNSAIHVNGTWTKATENGLSFGDILVTPAQDSEFGTRRAVFATPDGHFDWGIGYTYHFACTKTRFFFHYDHFNDGHNANSATQLSALGLPSSLSDNLVSGSGVVHNKSDEWTFGIDRRLAFGPCYVIDTAFFLEWDKVRRNFGERAVQDISPSPTVPTIARSTRDTYNRFRGFGPGIGIKGRGIPFACPNVGVFASFASTMLYGKNYFTSALYSSVTVEDIVSETLVYRLDPEESRSIVNKFDITFGVDYKRTFQLNCDQVQVGLALGMRYVNYINIFKNGNTFFNPLSPSSSFALNTGHAEDWGRVGPFLQLRIGGGDS